MTGLNDMSKLNKKTTATFSWAELAVRGFTDFYALKNITQLKNKLKEIMIEKDGIEQDKKDIKFFPILSDYDWSKFLV